MSDREQLERAIAAQEQLRGVVADDVIELTVGSLRDKLDALAPAGQRRRQATVLFADVRGFTSMAEAMDAEVVRDIMNHLWDGLDRVIASSGGRIDKHIGDGVMAVWGAESSSEDDPERAVTAALGLQLALVEENERSGRSLAMRVGVTTGPVLLGEVGSTREFTAMGDTVNVAARLEAAAPVGGVLISHDTYRHVRGLFDVSPQGPLTVRGRTRPIDVYVVHRAKEKTFRIPSRGVEGVETQMVGRDVEFGALQAGLDRVREAATAVIVTLIGDAGVGKSRLLYEFENWIDLLPAPVYYFKARALATRHAVPYGVFRDLLCSRFDIFDRDRPADVAAKLARGFAGYLSAEESELVGNWLGFDLPFSAAVDRLGGAESYSTVCAAHLTEFLRARASVDPVLLVLEDLHWADEESLDLLESVFRRLGDTRLLVVAAARPSLLDRRPTWLAGIPGASQQLIASLSEAASRHLVDEVLRHLDAVPREIADLIVGRADGNPFFLEELIKMLIDDGVIITGEVGDPWHVDLTRLDPATVPATLTGVLEARLDTLAGNERDTLQRASVIGRVFWEEAVCALAPARPSSETTGALEEVRSRELVFQSERSSLAANTEYVFKHALLRDVTYETVLLRDRKRLHTLVADWLAANAGDRLGELLELIAEHSALGGDPAAAAELFQTAAVRALAAGRSASTKRLVERALALWDASGVPPTAMALLALAEACCRMGRFNQADDALTAVVQSKLAAGLEAQALYLSSWVASEHGERGREAILLERALPLAVSVGGKVLRDVLMGLAWYEAGSGDLDGAERDARQALGLAEAVHDASGSVGALGALGAVVSLRGDLEESARCAERALMLAQSIGDLEAEALAWHNLGVVGHLRGDASGEVDHYEEARRNYGEQLSLLSRLGLDAKGAMTKLNLAQVSMRLAETRDAEMYLADALATIATGDLQANQLFAVIVEADLRLHQGGIDLALPLLGAVCSDPAIRESDRQEVARVVGRAHLAPEVVGAGMRLGEHRDLGEIVRDLHARYLAAGSGLG